MMSVKFNENISINVLENPIIENINTMNKSSRVEEALKDNALVKSRYSYNEIKIKRKFRLQEILENGLQI